MANEWDGFDSNATVYSEKEDRKFNSRMWWFFFVLSLIILIGLTYRVIKDNHLANTLPCIEGYYTTVGGRDTIEYIKDGKCCYATIPGYAIKNNGGNPLLFDVKGNGYYETIPALSSWLLFYIFFGIIFIVSSIKLKNVYFIKKHSGS